MGNDTKRRMHILARKTIGRAIDLYAYEHTQYLITLRDHVFPKGAPIRWVTNERLCVGTVVEFCIIAGITVRNDKTGNTYVIKHQQLLPPENYPNDEEVKKGENNAL
jgi:hypothetical protein